MSDDPSFDDAVSDSSVLERLAALPDLAGVPPEELEWLVRHGEIHRGADGFRVEAVSDFVGLILLISGRFSVRMRQNGVEREMREITPGRPTGYLPYSRMTNPRGYLVAEGPVEFLFIPKDDFPRLARECYEFTAVCVQEMLARVRVFKSDDKHQEKMAALGRLSAGLAHELNNPASAVVRGAGELEASRLELAAASLALGVTGVEGKTSEVLEALEAAARAGRDPALSPLDRSFAEDEVLEALESRGVDSSLAYPLAEAGLMAADLEAAASALDSDRFSAVVRYVAADAVARALADDILSAANRIHSLVAAVKQHTHMDRAPAVEPIRLEDHLAGAVALLSSKASLKKASVEVSLEADLPAVMGAVADLNQVWIHLIDNAIDAAPEAGRIMIEARQSPGAVVVCVVDDGPGIADEDHDRVFEPFFTTKEVSRGRGLGLDIVRTVVNAHRGAVELSSRPGRTEFRVTLPAAETSE